MKQQFYMTYTNRFQKILMDNFILQKCIIVGSTYCVYLLFE